MTPQVERERRYDPQPTAPRFNQGDRLRKARQMIGLDQQEFGELLGISRGTVSNYERAHTAHRRLVVIRAWALATGVPVKWLLEADRYTKDSPPPKPIDSKVKTHGVEPPV